MSKITQQEIASQVNAEVTDVSTNQAAPEMQIKNPERKSQYFTARKIATLAMFVAIALVCKLIGKSLTLTPTFTVSFIYIPWLMSGALLGPVAGMIVGFCSDIIGNAVFASPLNPLTLLSNTLFPLPIALIYKLSKDRGNDYAKSLLGLIASLVMCTLGIGSVALYWFYGYYESMNFFSYLLVYRTPQVGVLCVNAVVLMLLLRPLQSVGLYPRSTASASGAKIAVYANIFVSFALYAAAMITVTIKGYGSAPTYVILSAIYALITLIGALVFVRRTDKSTFALAVSIITALLIIALTATIASDKVHIVLKYILSALFVLSAVGATVFLSVRRAARSRSKHI